MTFKSTIKGELERENKMISYEREFKRQENDMYITGIGPAVLELLSFQVEPKGNLLTSKIVGNLRKCEARFTKTDITSDRSRFPNKKN